MKTRSYVCGGALALALILAVIPSRAWATDNVPKTLKYDLDSSTKATERTSGAVNAVTELFAEHGFTDLAPPIDPANPLHMMDRIYATAEFGRTAFLKINLKPLDKNHLRKMFQQDDAFLYHGRSPGGTWYAVYLMSFTSSDARKFVDEIDSAVDRQVTTMQPKPRRSTVAAIRVLNYLWSLPVAHADETCTAPISSSAPIGAECQSSFMKSLKAAGSVAADIAVSEVGCAWGLVQGPFSAAKDATWGVAKAIWNWRETGSAIWKAGKFVKDNYKQIASITAKYLSEHFEKDYLNLPPWAQGQAVCKTIAKLATNIVIIGFTMGAGGAGLAVKIGQALAAMGKAGEITAVLVEVGTKVASAGAKVAEGAKAVEVVEGAGAISKALVTTGTAIRTGAGVAIEVTGNAIVKAAPVVEAVVQPIAAAPVISTVVTKTGKTMVTLGTNRGLRLTAKAARSTAKRAASAAARAADDLADAYADNQAATVTEKFQELEKLAAKAREAAKKAQAVADQKPNAGNIKIRNQTLAAETEANSALEKSRRLIMQPIDAERGIMSQEAITATQSLGRMVADATKQALPISTFVTMSSDTLKKAMEKISQLAVNALKQAEKIKAAGYPVDLEETRRLVMQTYNESKEELLSQYKEALDKVKAVAKSTEPVDFGKAHADLVSTGAAQLAPIETVELGTSTVAAAVPDAAPASVAPTAAEPAKSGTPAPKAKPTLTKKIIDKMYKTKSLKELKKLPIGDEGQNLVASMEGDQFHTSSAFGQGKDMKPIADILARGVKSVKRTTFSSVQNGGVGYDIVRYEVTHPDGKTSIIYSFRQADGPWQSGIGFADMRPTLQAYYVNDGAGVVTENIYKNGVLESSTAGKEAQGLATARRFIDESLAKRGIREVGPAIEIALGSSEPAAAAAVEANAAPVEPVEPAAPKPTIRERAAKAVQKYKDGRQAAKTAAEEKAAETKFRKTAESLGIDLKAKACDRVRAEIEAYFADSSPARVAEMRNDLLKDLPADSPLRKQLLELGEAKPNPRTSLQSVEEAQRVIGVREDGRTVRLSRDEKSGAIVADYLAGYYDGQKPGAYNLPEYNAAGNYNKIGEPVKLPNGKGYAVKVLDNGGYGSSRGERYYLFKDAEEAQRYVKSISQSKADFATATHDKIVSIYKQALADNRISELIQHVRGMHGLEKAIGWDDLYYGYKNYVLRLLGSPEAFTAVGDGSGLQFMPGPTPGTVTVFGETYESLSPEQLIKNALPGKTVAVEDPKILRLGNKAKGGTYTTRFTATVSVAPETAAAQPGVSVAVGGAGETAAASPIEMGGIRAAYARADRVAVEAEYQKIAAAADKVGSVPVVPGSAEAAKAAEEYGPLHAALVEAKRLRTLVRLPKGIATAHPELANQLEFLADHSIWTEGANGKTTFQFSSNGLGTYDKILVNVGPENTAIRIEGYELRKIHGMLESMIRDLKYRKHPVPKILEQLAALPENAPTIEVAVASGPETATALEGLRWNMSIEPVIQPEARVAPAK